MSCDEGTNQLEVSARVTTSQSSCLPPSHSLYFFLYCMLPLHSLLPQRVSNSRHLGES